MIRIKDKVEYATTRVHFSDVIKHDTLLDIDVLIGEFDSYHMIDDGEIKLWDNLDVAHGVVNVIHREDTTKKFPSLTTGQNEDVPYFVYTFEKEIDAETYADEFVFNGKSESRRQLMENTFRPKLSAMIRMYLDLVVPKTPIMSFTAKGHELDIVFKDDSASYGVGIQPFMRRTAIEFLQERLRNGR